MTTFPCPDNTRFGLRLIDGHVAVTDHTTGTVTVLPQADAVGLASGLAAMTATATTDTTVDLSSALWAASQQLHRTLAAWQPDLYPSPARWHDDPFAAGDYPAVPDHVTAVCDNRSVGVIITDDHGRYLMFERVRPPVGIAPAAGHIDDHGTAADAARAEVAEELGLTVTALTPILHRWRSNVCRRRYGVHGPGHDWTVYRADVTGTLNPAADETRNARWYTPTQLQRLTDRTVAYANGDLTTDQFNDRPGLEPVWVEFLVEAELITVSLADLSAVNRLASQSPYA